MTHSPAFDLGWLRSRLEACLWQEQELPGKIDRLEILNTWDSGKGVTVMYEAWLSDPQRPPVSQLYVGRVLPEERLFAVFAELQEKGRIQPPRGRAVTLVPEANLVLLAYPNDEELHLMDCDILRASLASRLPALSGGELNAADWEIRRVEMEVLRYVPGKRFTTRCRVAVANRRGEERPLRFIAKQLKNGQKAAALYENLAMVPKIWADHVYVEDMSRLSEKDFNFPVRLPSPLCLDEQHGIVYFEELPGKNLEDALVEIDFREVIPMIGELLAHFHCACKPVRKIVSFDNEQEEAREAARKICRKFPGFRDRIAALLEGLAAVPEKRAHFIALLHGTFRLNHIFVHENEIFLLDLDSVRMGHPGYDVANFLSSLYYLEAQERISPFQRQEVTRLFLWSYDRHTRWPVTPRVVLWYLVSLLIHKQAYKYIKHLHPDREVKVGEILSLAEKMLRLYRDVAAETPLRDLAHLLPDN